MTAAKQAGWRVTIVSSDKDLMQLVDEDAGIDMLDTMNDRRIGRNEVLEKFGVPPEKVGDVLALMGDSVDNVPGVPGIGPKTAIAADPAIMATWKTVLAIDRRDHQAEAQAVADRPCRRCAAVSRELVRLVCDAPLPEPLEDLALKGIPPEPLQEFLEDQGFKSLLNRLIGGGAQARSSSGATVRMTSWRQWSRSRPRPPEPEQIEVDRSKYETVTDEAALDRWIAEATAQGYVAIDTETDCIDCIIAKLAGVSLATAPNRACYIPVGHSGGDLLFRGAATSCRCSWCSTKLKPLLEDPAVLKIGHNLKYDWVMFDKAGIDVAPVDDTMVMSFDLDAGRSFGHGLDELAKLHFEHECIPFKQLCGTGAKQITFDKVPLEASDRICRRGRGYRASPVAAAEAAAGCGECDAGLRARRQAAGAGTRADGAARGQGRPRLSGAA